MKRFLLKTGLAFGLVIVLLVGVLLGRTVHGMRKVKKAFTVPPGTEVLFIGNSHTGCTFAEAPEFRNRVLWYSGCGFVLHYLRFLELERRGVLDRGVKACVLDCDNLTLEANNTQTIKEKFRISFLFAWRYLDKIPVPKGELLREVLLRWRGETRIQKRAPAEAPTNWTTFSPEKKHESLAFFFGKNYLTPMTWDVESAEYPRGMMLSFDKMVCDMKRRCEKRGIRLILFASPLPSDAPDRVNPAIWKQIEDLGAHVRSLGCEYYDFRRAVPDDQFRDPSHLLRSGSYAFTKRFYAEILKIPVGE